MTDGYTPKDHVSEAAAVGNSSQLTAANSQICNVAQIIGSPGAVVNQVNVEQSSAIAGILAGILGVLLLLLVEVLPMIGKPTPNALAAFLIGLSSAMIVTGFFSWVENLLTNDTKSDIAGWLFGVNVGQKVEPWPKTFIAIFDQVFGKRHLTWKCFFSSAAVTVAIVLATSLLSGHFSTTLEVFKRSWLEGGQTTSSNPFVANAVMTVFVLRRILIRSVEYAVFPDYLSLLATRSLLSLMQKFPSVRTTFTILAVDLLVTGITPVIYWNILSFTAGLVFTQPVGLANPFAGHGVYFFPTFFTSIWLWLYAGSGFLLKNARRFDIGFQWFNRKFDIEKKPLSAMGLAAGALVALVYWLWRIVSRFIGT